MPSYFAFAIAFQISKHKCRSLCLCVSVSPCLRGEMAFVIELRS
jgi:hypothetical protein